jgi:hypothetical protein
VQYSIVTFAFIVLPSNLILSAVEEWVNPRRSHAKTLRTAGLELIETRLTARIAQWSEQIDKQILERPVVIHLNPAQPGTRAISRGQDRTHMATFFEDLPLTSDASP